MPRIDIIATSGKMEKWLPKLDKTIGLNIEKEEKTYSNSRFPNLSYTEINYFFYVGKETEYDMVFQIATAIEQEIILHPLDKFHATPTIEIYDDWRE